jgi:hypothetical protein
MSRAERSPPRQVKRRIPITVKCSRSTLVRPRRCSCVVSSSSSSSSISNNSSNNRHLCAQRATRRHFYECDSVTRAMFDRRRALQFATQTHSIRTWLSVRQTTDRTSPKTAGSARFDPALRLRLRLLFAQRQIDIVSEALPRQYYTPANRVARRRASGRRYITFRSAPFRAARPSASARRVERSPRRREQQQQQQHQQAAAATQAVNGSERRPTDGRRIGRGRGMRTSRGSTIMPIVHT